MKTQDDWRDDVERILHGTGREDLAEHIQHEREASVRLLADTEYKREQQEKNARKARKDYQDASRQRDQEMSERQEAQRKLDAMADRPPWETVAEDHVGNRTERLQIYGGWLVRTIVQHEHSAWGYGNPASPGIQLSLSMPNVGVAFVPDPDHLWNIPRAVEEI